MKRFTLLFICVFAGYFSSAQEIDMARIQFVNEFCAAVLSHDEAKVIQRTDKDYRKEQIKFLDGNKTQFVNELLSGLDIDSDDYINAKLTEIESIEIVEAREYGQGEWEYVFHLKVGAHIIQRSLLLKKDRNKFGFIGSQG